jgi:hypothetical protein
VSARADARVDHRALEFANATSGRGYTLTGRQMPGQFTMAAIAGEQCPNIPIGDPAAQPGDPCVSTPGGPAMGAPDRLSGEAPREFGVRDLSRGASARATVTQVGAARVEITEKALNILFVVRQPHLLESIFSQMDDPGALTVVENGIPFLVTRMTETTSDDRDVPFRTILGEAGLSTGLTVTEVER